MRGVSRLFLNNFWIHIFRTQNHATMREPKTFGYETKKNINFHAEYAFFSNFSIQFTKKRMIYALWLFQRWKIKYTTKENEKFTHDFFFVSTYLDGKVKIAASCNLFEAKKPRNINIPRATSTFQFTFWVTFRSFSPSLKQYAA